MEHIIGVGIDVVDVERVRRAFQRHGQRFLRKVFTPREARRAAGRRGAERLAARFAAKEATLKAMGTGLFPGARWTDVEVVRGPLGAPGIRLHGRVAEKASELGVTGFLVSLTHERTVAIAQVMALAPRPREDGTSR